MISENSKGDGVLKYITKYSLSISFIAIAGCFFVSRFPFFAYFPFPGGFSTSDTLDYFKVALEIQEGKVPFFDVRTPGYPLFLFVIELFSNKVMSIILVQNIITLLTACFFTYAVHSSYKKLTYAATAVVIFYFMMNHSIEEDSTLLTNSLYTNLLILFVGGLIVCLNKNRYWVLLSVCFGAIIYVRPSGLFLVPIVILILIFLFRSGEYKYAWLKLLIPGGVMLFSLSVYNLFTIGKFSVSPWGGMNVIGVVVTFVSNDPSYSECENKAIDYMRANVSEEDKRNLEMSSDMGIHHEIYFINYYNIIPFYKNLVKFCGYSGYVEALPSIKKISFDSIKKNPAKYLKFVTTNLYYYIVHGNLDEHQLFYYSEPARRYETIFSHNYPKPDRLWIYALDSVPLQLIKYTYKEFYDAHDDLSFKERYQALINNPLFKLYDIYTLKINRVFLRNWFWPLSLIALFFISGIKLLISGLKDKEALLIFVICNVNICSAIVVSLVEVSFYHYTYMTEFTYYMAVALSPLLFTKKLFPFLFSDVD
ncbi:MAG: hypothetical protein SH857_09605 [Chitinophagales bacterium]|nr:hypothetical protein [Chitinophagales bacterium]